MSSRKFIDVLEPAEEPKKGKGLYFMDTSSAAADASHFKQLEGLTFTFFQQGKEIL